MLIRCRRRRRRAVTATWRLAVFIQANAHNFNQTARTHTVFVRYLYYHGNATYHTHTQTDSVAFEPDIRECDCEKQNTDTHTGQTHFDQNMRCVVSCMVHAGAHTSLWHTAMWVSVLHDDAVHAARVLVRLLICTQGAQRTLCGCTPLRFGSFQRCPRGALKHKSQAKSPRRLRPACCLLFGAVVGWG